MSFIQGAIEKTYAEQKSELIQETKAEEAQKEITIKTSNEISNLPDNLKDQELAELISEQEAKIKVIGCGGAGCNTLNRINELGIVGAETIIINTDAQDLLAGTADKKILIGKDLTKGLGAGGKPTVGRDSAKESEKTLRKTISGSDLVFITCGLGGGTGTGSAPIVAELARKSGALTVAIATIPFKMEGGKRTENAMLGIDMLDKSVDTLILIPNDKLLSIAQDLPLQTAFKVADEILASAVKGVTELITTTGLVNLDFADIRAVLGNGGISLIGVGESDSDNKAAEAVEKALNNPILEVDVMGAQGALINVIGGNDLKLEEAKTIVGAITDRLDSNARIIWGAQINDDMDGTIKVLLVVTGIESEYGQRRPINNQNKRNQSELAENLGIEFV